MSWTRLPTFFPNFSLRMLPLSTEQLQQLRETGWLREVAFRTEPRVSKLEIAGLLRTVYGLNVERINTINYEGKKKRILDPKGRPKWYRQTDWKKVYVMLKPPVDVARAAEAKHQEAVRAFEQQRRDSVASGIGRQRYELLPLAVRHALMGERPDGRAAQRQQGKQQQQQEQQQQQRGRRRLEFVQPQDGGGK